jgi:hypothetical protein
MKFRCCGIEIEGEATARVKAWMREIPQRSLRIVMIEVRFQRGLKDECAFEMWDVFEAWEMRE